MAGSNSSPCHVTPCVIMLHNVTFPGAPTAEGITRITGTVLRVHAVVQRGLISSPAILIAVSRPEGRGVAGAWKLVFPVDTEPL